MRPLANLFAFHSADPEEIRKVWRALEDVGDFSDLWHPAPGWLCALAPLPGGDPDPAVVRDSGFAFLEGREMLGREPLPRCLEDLAHRVDTCPDSLGRLPGDFGFLRFRRDGTATVVRSCAGLVPIYVCQTPGRFVICTRLTDRARYVHPKPELDAFVNALWSTFFASFPRGRTPLRDVFILDSGSWTSIDPKNRHWVTQRYWNPRRATLPAPSSRSAGEHAEELRAILIGRLRTDLDPHGANLLTLSGGVDSSSLAALAAGPVGLSFSALSFLPAEERAFRHDLSFLEPLSQRFAFARHDVRLQPERALAMRDLIPPVVFPVTHPPLCILSELCKKSPTLVLFGGEFADNFCGSKLTLGDWARHASALRLLLAPREIPWGFTGARTWVGHRVRRIAGRVHLPYPPGLPDFFTPDLQAEYSEWRLQQERTLLRDRLPRPELALGLKCCGSIAMNWEVSSFLGVRRAYPFFNREMLELAFRLHPSELLGPGVKKILRRALSGDVPARNLNRQDKGLASPERLKARMAWKAPLPHSLEPLFKPVFWRQPPRELEYLDALRLKQLVNIVRAIDIQTKSGAHALGHSP